MTTPAIVTAVCLFALAGAAWLAYRFSGGTRASLLFLGYTFCLLAASEFLRSPLYLLPLLLAVLALIKSVLESIREMKARWLKMQEEQQAREEAFAEIQTALVQKVAEDKDSEQANEKLQM